MAKIELTDPLIVNHARRGYQFFLAEGDEHSSALSKSIAAALAKHWRKKPLNMTDPRNMDRLGKRFADLEALVVRENRVDLCSSKRPQT